MTALLQDFLRGQVEARPEATALVMQDDRLSYGDLEERSNRLARQLLELGCAPGDRVCLFTGKSPAAVVAMHAVLKARCAYVPIDVASPAQRTAKIVAAADPKLIVADRSAAALLGDLADAGSLGRSTVLELTALDWNAFSGEPLPPAARPDEMAHILFTSGSTGTPKGVVITHANAASFVQWAVGYFGTRAGDRISGHPPLHFDLSTFDIYGTIAAGAELHLVPPELAMHPRGLASLIRDSELTQWFSVPSVLTYMAKFDAVRENDFPALERLLWCGEVLPTPVLVHWMKRLPHVRFTNLYGPTEATIASSYYTVPTCPEDQTRPVPIGSPCEGEQLLVLDPELRPLAPGEVGDLFISGAGLSPGYWRDEEKTREAFLPSPLRPDERIYRTGDLARVDDEGLFHFLGRADSQIKSRGYRIELGEVESAVNSIRGVRECAVVGVESGGFEGTAICCAYSAVAGFELDQVALRAALTRLLPTYMLPVRWLSVDSLPKNVNGKIDRRALRERFEADQGEARSPQASATSG